jgi:DNA-binding HxlR family transcriptional regulator
VVLLLRELFRGPQRFDDLQKKSGAATNIVTSRLKRMIDAGIVSKEPYQERPPRYSYKLTKAGLGLFPVVMELWRYGHDWMPSDMPPSTRLVHLD